MKFSTKLILAFTTLLVIAGCASRPAERQTYSSLPTLEAGWGRVYFSSGVIDIPYRPSIDIRYSSDIGPVFIDEVNVGSPANGEYIAVDLKPGSYKMKWIPQGATDNFHFVETILNVEPGISEYFSCDIKVVKVTFSSGAAGLIPALIAKGVEDKQSVEKTHQTIFTKKNDLNSSSRLVSYFKYDEASVPKTKLTKSKTNESSSERLKELQQLRKDRVITEQEYQQKKSQILKQM